MCLSLGWSLDSSGGLWESRWPSWAVHPNEPSGFRGRKAILNHASALVSACPWYINWHPRTLNNTTYLPRMVCQSPGEIKRREVSWILTKKLAQKRSRAGRWSWARERELDFFCFSCFPAAELQTLSLWLFCVAVGTATVWCGGHCAMPDGHCLNILLFWRQSMAALVFLVGACFEVSLFCPPFPTRPRP